MKKLRLLIRSGMLIMLIAVIACQPENDFPTLENPLALKTEVLEGTWIVSKVVQYDKEAIDNGFPEDVQSLDVTDLFNFNEFKLTFNLQESGLPGTFMVEEGSAPNFLGLTNGTWSLDDYVFATQIALNNIADVNASAFRVKLLKENLIQLQIVRNDLIDATEYSYYEYELIKE
jgi:hypothetical protein